VRLFVALEVEPPASEPAHERSNASRHLTLRFLGEVSPDRVPSIVEALTRVARETPSFDLVLEGVGAFPSRANPRVVWVGATVGRQEVSDLAERIDRALAATGGTPERERFVPHVTLFRVRSPELRGRAAGLLSGSTPPPAPKKLRAREFLLVESTLTSRGAVHRTLVAFPLLQGSESKSSPPAAGAGPGPARRER
jgi:RNA 2',3'-cyclic 3'-phosphodiesterase